MLSRCFHFPSGKESVSCRIDRSRRPYRSTAHENALKRDRIETGDRGGGGGGVGRCFLYIHALEFLLAVLIEETVIERSRLLVFNVGPDLAQKPQFDEDVDPIHASSHSSSTMPIFAMKSARDVPCLPPDNWRPRWSQRRSCFPIAWRRVFGKFSVNRCTNAKAMCIF